ncbi:VanZ family protein [Dinghuibacter silviterrae]|uniref:VanZ family protein n=1 Tax=Dinghuibacter silviterrae TaxID=1539049 RepID=A0A4R8DP36_9BACT|nr:VanZ family protein [Dinghuibacter silviterrae]TDW99467.1 VanZ family protein [Dinghuibacter silviterrae]
MLFRLLKRSYWPAIVWLAIIFILLVLPSRDVQAPHAWSAFLGRIHADKIVHFTLFGVLVGLWTIPYASRHSPAANTRFFLTICISACAFGAFMEWVQLRFTDRDYENGDIVADSLGAITGMIISMLWVRRQRRVGKL